MEKILSCNLNVEGENVEYHVVFGDEKYTFIPEDNDASAPTFSFARDNDWIAVDKIDPQLSKQAVDQLEKYLLSQH